MFFLRGGGAFESFLCPPSRSFRTDSKIIQHELNACIYEVVRNGQRVIVINYSKYATAVDRI